jgi:hypothetical protein
VAAARRDRRITRDGAQVRIVRPRGPPGLLRDAAPLVVVDNGVERGSCVEKFVDKVKQVKPLYAGAAVMIVIVIALIVITSGGGGDDKTATQGPSTSTTDKASKAKKTKPKGRRVREAPIGTTGVIDQARREGDFVVAQARGTIKTPIGVRLRMSAAPKQTVSVDWQLSCFKNRQVSVGKGKYRTKSPDERQIPLPMQGAETCIATAGAQLTRHGKGRVKIAVVGGN